MSRLCHLVLIASFALLCKPGKCQTNEQQFPPRLREVAGSLEQVVLAVKNALGDGAYHGKDLVISPYDYVRRGEEVVGISVPNRWRLFQGRLPLTLLSRGKTVLAYYEDFEIKAEGIGPDTTKVILTPSNPYVRKDRYELSMHLSRVLSTESYPALDSEATNLLFRIESQLQEIQAGRTNALPPTADTRPGFYRDFWTKMDVEEQHDLRNWKKMVEAWKALQHLQSRTNSTVSVTNAAK